jgi:uncharacterized protein
MDPDELILALLKAIPNHRIDGKKRLQKLAYLAASAGVESRTHFSLRDYGPYSPEVANAANSLTLSGVVTEDEQLLPPNNFFMTTYELPDPDHVNAHLPDPVSSAIRQLNQYSTIQLEVAATYLFFRNQGLDENGARERTVAMKPAKASTTVLARVPEILGHLPTA